MKKVIYSSDLSPEQIETIIEEKSSQIIWTKGLLITEPILLFISIISGTFGLTTSACLVLLAIIGIQLIIQRKEDIKLLKEKIGR